MVEPHNNPFIIKVFSTHSKPDRHCNNRVELEFIRVIMFNFLTWLVYDLIDLLNKSNMIQQIMLINKLINMIII